MMVASWAIATLVDIKTGLDAGRCNGSCEGCISLPFQATKPAE